MTAPVRIYTDGAYSPKNDVGGWSAIVTAPRLRDYIMMRGAEVTTTVNRMELQGIRRALVWCMDNGVENVCILTDSQYCVTVSQSSRDYARNAELIAEVRAHIEELRCAGGAVLIKWVKGHASEPGNVLADIAATQARDGLVKRLAALNG